MKRKLSNNHTVAHRQEKKVIWEYPLKVSDKLIRDQRLFVHSVLLIKLFFYPLVQVLTNIYPL